MMMKRAMAICLAALFAGCSNNSQQAEKLLAHFIDDHVEKIREINYQMNLSMWKTSTGQQSYGELSKARNCLQDSIQHPEFLTPDYRALLQVVYQDENEFQYLQRFKNSNLIHDPLLKRQLNTLCRNYFWTVHNFDKLTRKEEAVYDEFTQLRIDVNGLQNSKNDSLRDAITQRHYELEKNFVDLLQQQNNDLQALLGQNSYEYLLDELELTDARQQQLIDEIESITHDDYLHLKKLMDEYIMQMSGKNRDEIIYNDYNLCRLKFISPPEWIQCFTENQLETAALDFYNDWQLPMKDVLQNSDIWYDAKKPNVEFFFAVDPDTDLRLFANLRPTMRGFYIIMHEMAHAAYQKNIAANVPYLIKEAPIILSEGFALLMNDQLYLSAELRQSLNLPSLQNNPFYQDFRNPHALWVARYLLWRTEFERRMFNDPSQDLTTLWWDLAEKYMFIQTKQQDRKPAWTFDRHIILSNGMYQVYLNANVVAAQLQARIDSDPDFRQQLCERLFQHGNSQNWQTLLQQALDEPLNPFYLPNFYNKPTHYFVNK